MIRSNNKFLNFLLPVTLLYCTTVCTSQNLVINGGFENVNAPGIICETPFINNVPGWVQAHGSPQLEMAGGPCQNNISGPHSGANFAYGYSFPNGNQQNPATSEGIYQNLTLQSGKAYAVSAVITTASWFLEACSGLSPFTGNYSIPNPNIPSNQRQVIWSGSANGNISTLFYPNQTYSQIWFHGNPDYPTSTRVLLDDVSIIEVKPINQLSGTLGYLCGSTQFQIPISSSYYNWSIPSGNASISGSGNTVTVTPSGVGNVSICVAVSNGQTYCINVWSGPPTLTNVYVDNNLNPGPYAVSSNSTHFITSSSPNATSYSINSTRNSGDIQLNLSGINNGNCQINVAGTTGNGSVNITVSNCSGGYTRAVIFYIPSAYRMYSNPAKDNVIVEFTDTDYKDGLPDLLEIISEKSQEIVKSVDVQKLFDSKGFSEKNRVMISTHDLPDGTYYLRITNSRLSKDDKVKTLRLIISGNG